MNNKRNSIVHAGTDHHLVNTENMSREQKAELAFERLDRNHDGEISFAEFLALADHLSPEEIIVLRQQFNQYDVDHNGEISKDEWVTQTIRCYRNVNEAEFDQWIKVIMDGTSVHAHRKSSLEHAGIKVEDNYKDAELGGVIGCIYSVLVALKIVNPNKKKKKDKKYYYKGSVEDAIHHDERMKKLEQKIVDMKNKEGKNNRVMKHRNTEKAKDFEKKLEKARKKAKQAGEWEHKHHPEHFRHPEKHSEAENTADDKKAARHGVSPTFHHDQPKNNRDYLMGTSAHNAGVVKHEDNKHHHKHHHHKHHHHKDNHHKDNHHKHHHLFFCCSFFCRKVFF